MMLVDQVMASKRAKPKVISKRDKDSIKAALAVHVSVITVRNFHKFVIINGASFNREQVQAAIINHCYPHSITPLMYSVDTNGRDSYFLSSNCWRAIVALCSTDLTVIIPETYLKFEVDIYMDHVYGDDEKCSIRPLVDVARMSLRVARTKGSGIIIDCSRFHSHSDLTDYYFPLWAVHYQRILVEASRKQAQYVTHLNLSNNDIESLIGFARLVAPNLEELDLRNNKLEWSELVPLCPHKVRALWLDGNPLCSTPLTEYISKAKALYPNLQKLDGVSLFSEPDMVFIVKNSFVSITTYTFVDHFLHHYFKWFLKPDGRETMIDMYHAKATLSVSTNLRSSVESPTVNCFNDLSRNILKITNYARAYDSFKVDSSQIVKVLTSLPHLELDPQTATVDVPYYVENKAIQLCVSSIFRDMNRSMFWMSFIFMLQACTNTRLREWKIINQFISVTPATPEQCRNTFEFSMKEIDTTDFELTQDEMLSQFKELTSLNTSWCQQFLESTNWDLESALQSFVDQYKGDLVPENAFIQT